MVRVAAVLALLVAVPFASGCIEFVGDEPTQAAPPKPKASMFVVTAASEEERKVHLRFTQFPTGRGPVALTDVAVTADGRACSGLRAEGDTTWMSDEAVVLTPVTGGCGTALRSGADVAVRVVVEQAVAFAGNVTVR